MEPETNIDLYRNSWVYDIHNSFADAVRSSTQPSGKNEKPLFSVGDFVKLKSGEAPQQVTHVVWAPEAKCYHIKCEYLKSRKQLGFRPEHDFELYHKPKTKEEDPMKGKLFQTLDGTVYGEGLVIDGDGKYVLKLNNGEYKAFEASQLKRVMPFTFDVVFNGMSNKRYSYIGKAGSVEVGDVLMDSKDFTIARVVAVGTESDAATKTFEGVKLKTEPLE